MTLDETKIIPRTPGSFYARHPFVLSDGRRFASARCAAHSAAYNEGRARLSMHDEWSGMVYSHSECVEIVSDMETGGRRAS